MNRCSRIVDALLRFFRKNKYFAVFALAVAGVIALATFKDSIESLWDLMALKKKASADVAEIEIIKKEVEGHRDAIQMIVRDANAVRKEIEPLTKSVEVLHEDVEEAEQAMARLHEEQLLIASVGRATAFDRNAYHELDQLANGTNTFAPLARATRSKVQRMLILDRGDTTTLIPLERRGQAHFTGPFTTDELAMELRRTQPDGAINVVGQKKHRLFVPELVRLAERTDLWAANRISKALQDIAGVSFDPWDLSPLDAWWGENQSAFTNWPYEAYVQANAEFSGCRYADALKSFRSVLSIDPEADKSRALAVACALETGDLPAATNLMASFVQKGGRWDQWAQFKMILTTGTVEHATREFAELALRYPTFSDKAWISEGNHVLRKVDWRLYDDLISEEKKTTSNKTIQATSQ